MTPPMPGTRRLLFALLGLGALVRLAIAFATDGQAYDIGNVRMAGEAFAADPLSVYRVLELEGKAGAFELVRWPYPPGFLPFAALEDKLADALGLPFHGVVSLAPIAADLAIAWFVQSLLGARGATERTRVAAVALVALGPSFIVISGYHGQIDSVAILPAVAALWVWECVPGGRRALWAGLLVGVAACVKTVPIVMLVALVPAARSLREAALVVGAAGAVLVAALAPYLIADFAPVTDALSYAGAPGLGGLTMFLQPGLTDAFLTGAAEVPNELTDWAYRRASAFVAVGLTLAGLFLLRHRPRAVAAAPLVWLAVYVANPDWFIQYVVWGLPFFLIAGWLREVAALQVALVPIAVLTYGTPWGRDEVVVVYVAIMAGVWISWLALLARTGLRIARGAAV